MTNNFEVRVVVGNVTHVSTLNVSPSKGGHDVIICNSDKALQAAFTAKDADIAACFDRGFHAAARTRQNITVVLMDTYCQLSGCSGVHFAAPKGGMIGARRCSNIRSAYICARSFGLYTTVAEILLPALPFTGAQTVHSDNFADRRRQTPTVAPPQPAYSAEKTWSDDDADMMPELSDTTETASPTPVPETARTTSPDVLAADINVRSLQPMPTRPPPLDMTPPALTQTQREKIAWFKANPVQLNSAPPATATIIRSQPNEHHGQMHAAETAATLVNSALGDSPDNLAKRHADYITASERLRRMRNPHAGMPSLMARDNAITALTAAIKQAQHKHDRHHKAGQLDQAAATAAEIRAAQIALHLYSS